LKQFLTDSLLKEGTISPDDLKLITLADSPAAAVERIIDAC